MYCYNPYTIDLSGGARGAQCIDKKILIGKNCDIDIDKRTYE